MAKKNQPKVRISELPGASVLNNQSFDYQDSFQSDYQDDENTVSSTDIGKYFFTSAPNWTGALFKLRNRIVSLFGLKTSGTAKDREAQLQNFKCEPNERLGLFMVYHNDENEVVLGEDDKHLNFRISLYKANHPKNPNLRTLTISTMVTFHNRLGRLYFLPVKPFHRLIVPSMLKGILRQIGQQ